MTVNETTDEMDTLIRALDEVAYTVQDPHFVIRADKHPTPEEASNHDDSASTEADAGAAAASDSSDAAADMDQGRQAAGRGNRKGQRKAKGSDEPLEGDGDKK